MKNLIIYLLSIPKTIYINFKTLKFKQAIKFPIVISYKMKIDKIYKGAIEINSNISTFMIRIGFGGSEAIHENKGKLYLSKKGRAKLIFNGKTHIAAGTTIYNNRGTIVFGNNFGCNKNCFFSCNTKMIFGDDVMIGWNVNMRDSDGHKVVPSTEKNSEIIIGNHVWICSYVDILKSTNIGNNSIVAYRSCCIGTKAGENKLIGGYPAKIIKDDISWEY